MKKLILSAFCMGLLLTTAGVSAKNQSSFVSASVPFSTNDDRKVIKAEELPEAVSKALSGDAYKEWAVKEIAMVTPPESADKKTQESYYEVTLTHEKETRIVKFQKDGTLLN